VESFASIDSGVIFAFSHHLLFIMTPPSNIIILFFMIMMPRVTSRDLVS